MTAFELGADPSAELEDLFLRRGRLAYGEAVDQLAHALQLRQQPVEEHILPAGACSGSLSVSLEQRRIRGFDVVLVP